MANGMIHIQSSPYHLSTNEAAECVVQTVKHPVFISPRRAPLEHILATFYCSTAQPHMLRKELFQVPCYWVVPSAPAWTYCHRLSKTEWNDNSASNRSSTTGTVSSGSCLPTNQYEPGTSETVLVDLKEW